MRVYMDYRKQWHDKSMNARFVYMCVFYFRWNVYYIDATWKKEGAATGGNIWQRLYVDWHWVLLWMSASVAIIRHVADFEHFWRLCSAIMKMSRSAMSVNFDVSVVVMMMMMLVMMNWMDGEYLTFRVQLLSQLTCNKSIRHWSYVGLIMSAGSCGALAHTNSPIFIPHFLPHFYTTVARIDFEGLVEGANCILTHTVLDHN